MGTRAASFSSELEAFREVRSRTRTAGTIAAVALAWQAPTVVRSSFLLSGCVLHHAGRRCRPAGVASIVSITATIACAGMRSLSPPVSEHGFWEALRRRGACDWLAETGSWTG